MKRFFRLLFLPITRLILIYALEIAITVNVLLYINGMFSIKSRLIDIIINNLRLVTIICFAFVLLNNRIEQAYKTNWIIILLLSPSFGGIIYLLFAKEKPFFTRYSKIQRLKQKYNKLSQLRENEYSAILRNYMSNRAYQYCKTINYLSCVHNFSFTNNANVKFFHEKGDGWSDIISSLKKAKKSICMEFFIISDGKLFAQITDILIEKKKENIDIKILYDAWGSFGKISHKTIKKLKKNGIKINKFNRVRLLLDQQLNYRNHRKLIIIDKDLLYTGGVNLADEYKYENKKFFWFDSVIKISGIVARDGQEVFNQDWFFSTGTEPNYALQVASDAYRPQTDEYYQFYASSPFNSESIIKNIFISLLMQSKKTFYFVSPYLVLDNDTLEKVTFCAKSGLDIKIIVPGVPDKKITYSITKSHFNVLIKNGIKIYKYKKGFIHSKIILCDDICASVGSANIDYRSFFINFEDGILLYNSPEVKSISNTFNQILDECEEVGKIRENIFVKIFKTPLKLLSPIF